MDYVGWIVTLGMLATMLLLRCLQQYGVLLDVGMIPKHPPVQVAGVVATRIEMFPNWFLFPSFVALIGLSVLCYFSPQDASVALIVSGFTLLLAAIRLHARSEVLAQRDIGLAFNTGLLALAMLTFCSSMGSAIFAPALELALAVALLAVGAITCRCLAVGLPFARTALGMLPLTVILFLQQADHDEGLFAVKLDRAMAVEFVEGKGGSLEAEHYVDSSELARVLRALARDGGRVPDVSIAKEALIASILRWHATGAGEELLIDRLESYGYFRGRDYEEIGILELAWALEERRGRPSEFFMYTAIKALRSRELSPDARLLLADELAGAQLVPGFSSASSFIVSRLRVLEQLGHPEKGESYRRAARAWLVSQVPDQLTDTSDAVHLMARFGVPDGIDLVEIHDTLEVQARISLFGTPKVDGVLAYVTLASIERLPEWEAIAESRSGLLYLLWSHRVALTALLIATASVLITLRMPRAVISKPAV